jgi:uncharacterized protein (DUF302 family)
MEDYGRRLIVDVPFDVGLVELTSALREQGLDLAGTLNVHEYLRRRLHEDCRRYVLLEVTSPELLLATLRRDLAAGAALPVTIAVYEMPDGETAVVAGEPFAATCEDHAWRTAEPELAALADRATGQLARALQRLQIVTTRRPLATLAG